MKPVRRERISSFLRAEIAQIIQQELKDPRIGFVSVLDVEPTEDLKEAKVYISVLGEESDQRTTLRGLEAARGFIQTRLGDRVHFRNTPQLRFILDDSIRKTMEVEELIKRAREVDARGRGLAPEPGKDPAVDEGPDDLAEDGSQPDSGTG